MVGRGLICEIPLHNFALKVQEVGGWGDAYARGEAYLQDTTVQPFTTFDKFKSWEILSTNGVKDH